MWTADVEGDAESMYRRAGHDPDDAVSPRVLCEELLGSRPAYALIRSEAELARVMGQWRVFVRRGTPPARARWLVGHELAEWWYQEIGYTEPDLEQRCDALGAALVVPRRVFRRAVRAVGDDVAKLARRLRTTQSLALLRRGEVLGEPAALVRARGATVRGDAFVWPMQLELRACRRARHPAVDKVPITDEPGRIGLFGRDVEVV